MIVGFIEGIVWSFIVVFIISLPFFNVKEFKESKYRDKILNHTPILSSVAKNSINVINDFMSLREKYEDAKDAKAFNRETVDIFLKYDVVSYDSVKSLVKSGKLKVDDVDKLLEKYKDAK